MVETGLIISKQHRLASTKVQDNSHNRSKLYIQFLYEAIIVLIFVLVYPFFRSQSPESINQTLQTTSWGILRLIFVRTAVSYGLKSKHSVKTEGLSYC